MSKYLSLEGLEYFYNQLNNKFATKSDVGSPLKAATSAGMTDTDNIYVYTGSETGYTFGHWYYYDNGSWVDGGIYNSSAVETDKTLSEDDMPADAKVTGDEIAGLKSATNKAGESMLVYLQTSWESGSMDADGDDIVKDNRYRSGFVSVDLNESFYCHVPRYCGIYIYEFDALKNFVTGQGWFVDGVNQITLNPSTRYIRAVVRKTDDSTSNLSYVPSNAFIMQSNRFGAALNVVDNPTCVPGAVSDYGDYSNINSYATNRRNTIFIPTEHKFVKVELAEGYLAYLFQYDEDFEFIREDGWMDDVYARSLEPNCKYIRISIKNDAGNSISAFDSLVNKLKIVLFDSITTLSPNQTLQSTCLISHRGSNSAPENTIPAIEEAITEGFAYIEVDLEFTSDNVCVLLHDTTIDRTSNGTGNIYDMTYEQVLQYDFGSWKSATYTGTKIPTLEETLLLCKHHNVCLQLDIASTTKTNITVENLEEMLRVINITGAQRNVVICAYNDRARQIIGLQQGLNMVLGLGGLAKEKIVDFVSLCSFFAFSSEYASYSQTDAEYFHSLGAYVQTWEIDEQQTAEEVFGDGVDWIITNTLLP